MTSLAGLGLTGEQGLTPTPGGDTRPIRAQTLASPLLYIRYVIGRCSERCPQARLVTILVALYRPAFEAASSSDRVTTL